MTITDKARKLVDNFEQRVLELQSTKILNSSGNYPNIEKTAWHNYNAAKYDLEYYIAVFEDNQVRNWAE